MERGPVDSEEGELAISKALKKIGDLQVEQRENFGRNSVGATLVLAGNPTQNG
jgi:hypothetical protein